MLAATAAAAADTKLPRLIVAEPDWQQATQAAGDAGLAALNTAAAKGFAGIAKSSIPVLLPFDKEVLAGFQATAFFNAGAAGYDAAFAVNTADVKELSDIRYKEPVYVLMSGLRFTYELDGPALPPGEPVKALEDTFPASRARCTNIMCATASPVTACLMSPRSSAAIYGRGRSF